MPDNKSIFVLCDNILNIANSSPDRTSNRSFLNLPKEYNVVMIDMAIAQLAKDNYIRLGTNNPDYFNITALGQLFISNNGYEAQLAKEQKREAYTDQLQASTLATNKSVQDTNTITKTNFNIQKRLGYASLFVSLSAIIISTIALFRDNEKETRQIYKEAEMHLRILDSIRQDLKAIQSFRDTATR